MYRWIQAATLILLVASGVIGEAFGVWKLNPARSTRAGTDRSVILRIGPHRRGEVLTVDTVAADGRASTSSTILYFDGKPRDFRDSVCSGEQSSWRKDEQTVEILRECADGGRVQLVRRAVSPGLMVLEITEQSSEGHPTERRLVFEKR